MADSVGSTAYGYSSSFDNALHRRDKTRAAHIIMNSSLRKAAVGNGSNRQTGSPIDHVERIAAPVLMFHGELDRDVFVEESKRMATRLSAAGKACKLVTWPDLDDDLVDSTARAQMLRSSDEFIRQTLGLGADLAGVPPAAGSPE